MNFAVMNESRNVHRPMKMPELFDGLDVELPPESGKFRIGGVSSDSRTVQKGDLFIAIPGYSQDGRRYISEAVSLGAVAVLTVRGTEISSDVPIILADSLREVIPEIGNRFFGYPSKKLRVSGITGTNGKTTTAYLLAAVFNFAGERWGKIGTISYDTGARIVPAQNTTPGSIAIQKFLAEMVENGMHGCAMEVSSHALDQGRCAGIKFSSATFTNLTQDHLDYHKNMEDYFSAKARLFEDVDRSIINVDDIYGRRLIQQITGNVVTYGFGHNADLQCRSMETAIDHSMLEFKYNIRKRGFRLPLPGLFNHYNAAAAAATALSLGLSLVDVTNGLAKASTVPGRMQAVTFNQPFGVYVDYAHTPEALERLLESVASFKPKNIHLVFGCGGDRDVSKRPLMARAASKYANYIYLTSDNPRTEDPSKIIKDAMAGMVDKKKCRVIEDRALAIKTAIASAKEGDIVVIAGKGHEEYQIIGTVKKYFSDIEAVKSELRKLGYDEQGGK